MTNIKEVLIKTKNKHDAANYLSWKYDEDTDMWAAPVAKPDSGMWSWSETTSAWVEQSYHETDTHVVCAYPRSGSTYLNHYLALAYGTNGGVFRGNWHTEDKIKNSTDKVIVTVRNPLDCIASWANYQTTLDNFDVIEVTDKSIADDIAYYMRFTQAVVDNKDNCLILDFDKVTTDLTYVDSAISGLGLTKVKEVTDADVKAFMAENERLDNLPRNDKATLDAIKTRIEANSKYADCVTLYNTVKGLAH